MESYVRKKFTESKAGHDFIFIEQKLKELLKARLEEGDSDSQVREDLSFVNFLILCLFVCLLLSLSLLSICLSLFIMHCVYLHVFVSQHKDLLQLLIDARADSDEEAVKTLPPSKRKLTDVEIVRTSFSFVLAGKHNVSVCVIMYTVLYVCICVLVFVSVSVCVCVCVCLRVYMSDNQINDHVKNK